MGKNAPTLQEVAAFLEAAEAAGELEHALACLLALNGLSLRAVCEAGIAGLEHHDGTDVLHVSLTGGAPMPVPLAPRTAHALHEHLGERHGGPLLVGEAGLPLTPDGAAQIVRRVVRDAGLSYRLWGS